MDVLNNDNRTFLLNQTYYPITFLEVLEPESKSGTPLPPMSVGLDKIPIVCMMFVIIIKFEIKTFTVCASEA